MAWGFYSLNTSNLVCISNILSSWSRHLPSNSFLYTFISSITKKKVWSVAFATSTEVSPVKRGGLTLSMSKELISVVSSLILVSK